MRIGLLAPVATADVAHLLADGGRGAPQGYPGAPFVATLIETFLQLGHDVVAFTSDRTLDPSGNAVVLEGPNFRLWLCPARPNGTMPRMKSPIGRIWDFFRVERRHLARAVAQERTDILHAHWTYEFAMVAIASGRPCLVTIHDSPADILRLAPTPYTIGRYLMAQYVLNANISLTAVSPHISKVARDRSNKKSIYLISNPLPTWLKTIERPTPEPKIPREKLTVTMAPGYWSRFKNPLPGVQAFSQLESSFETPVEMHLFGADFAPNGKAELAIRRAGIPIHNIRFHGQLEHKALLQEINKSSAFLHTSLTESFGMAVAEAMAIGIPVIAGQNSGAIPWLLQHGTAGQLVNVTSVDDIRTALLKALNGAPLINEQTRIARKSIWQLTDSTVVAMQYLESYIEIIQAWPIRNRSTSPNQSNN